LFKVEKKTQRKGVMNGQFTDCHKREEMKNV